MTKTIPQTPQGNTPAAPQKRRRKKFYRMKFIDSSDVICIANNFYSCDELSAHSNRDRSAFIQIWMMEPGRKPHLVWTGYPRDLEEFMKTKFKAVLKYNYYITKNTFCRPARTESNIFTYNNIVIDIDDHESSSGMVAWEKDVLKTELLYAADGELLDVEIPPISAIVDTGRGLQVWYSFDGIAAKNKKAYRLVTEAIIDKVQQVCEKIHDEHPEFVMKVDVAASKNAAGLVRLPGTTNAKTKNVSEIVYFNEEMKNRKFFGQDGLSSVLFFSALATPDSTIKASKKKKNKVPVTKDGKPVPTCVVADALERLFELRDYSKVPATGIRDLLLYIYFNTIFQHRGPAIAMKKTIWLNSKFANPLSETELDNAVGHISSKLSEVVCTDGTTSYVPGYILPYSYIIETLQITAAELKQIKLTVPKAIAKNTTKKKNARAVKEKNLLEERNAVRIMHINNPELSITELAARFHRTRKWASNCVNSAFEGIMAGAVYVRGRISKMSSIPELAQKAVTTVKESVEKVKEAVAPRSLDSPDVTIRYVKLPILIPPVWFDDHNVQVCVL